MGYISLIGPDAPMEIFFTVVEVVDIITSDQFLVIG